MAQQVSELKAQARARAGTGGARATRREDKVPGVVYGDGREPENVALNGRELNIVIGRGKFLSTVFDLDIDGKKSRVIPREVQLDPVKDWPIHVDFQRVGPGARIRVNVPVHTVGDPQGVKLQGGLHELITREIEIECLPDEIPEHFTVDVSELMIGQSVRASEIVLSGSMILLSPPESVISHVVVLKAEEEPAAAAVVEGAAPPAATEPEVIKKGKKEEEGEAPEEKKGKK